MPASPLFHALIIKSDCQERNTVTRGSKDSHFADNILVFWSDNENVPPNNSLSMNEQTIQDYSDIEISIVRERLRQARYSFNVALAASAVSACIGFIGAGLLLLGTVSEGTVTALGGAVSCAGCLCLAKDSNERLDKIAQEIMDDV